MSANPRQQPEIEAEAVDTRQRLLDAGTIEFAERGLDASIRQICARAGANQAAVNYHFGSKQKFYAEVLVGCHQRAVAKRPMPRLADGPERPRQVFRRWVRWMLELLLVEGTGTPLGQLMARELCQPSAAFDELVRRSILPLHQALSEIIEALIGPVDALTLRLHVNSVLGQCLVYKHAEEAVKRLDALNGIDIVPPDLVQPAAKLDALARHIAAFSLAGLSRQRLSEGDPA